MKLSGTVYSETLGMETGLSILTPKDYQPGQPYKVAYLLHGLASNHESWLSHTMLPVYGNKYEMIFVMPEVNRSLYQDMASGLNYFTYISQELPAIIQNTFNISARKEDTYVMGASMGGYGALRCALTYPAVFGHGLAFSSAMLFLTDHLTSEPQRTLNPSLTLDIAAAFGNKDLRNYEELDLLHLAAKVPVEQRPAIYLSCGSRDHLLASNRAFKETLTKRGWEITYTEFSGGHDWYHFNEALIKGLRWTRRQ